MARSCGIHIDQRHFHVVAMEGSARKSRVLASASGEILPGTDPVAEVSRALRAIVKKEKIHADSVGLAVDSGLAAFRFLTVPFDDRSKIEDIIKFEVESDLPQWNIDEVIVDFLVLGTKPGVESNLLVTAIPKARLERQLFAAERGGLEATQAELDGTALFNAAHANGLLEGDAAQILVHVGDSTTTVAVADGGKLVSLRAIRAGAFPPVRSRFEESGEDAEAEVEPEESEEVTAERVAQTVRRLRRELGRTLSAAQTEGGIEAVYVCGHAMPGLTDEPLFDVPVLPLDVFPVTQGENDQVLTVAYGAALRALGGGALSPELRREDLRYSGKFERLELPLAVFSLLLCTLLVVKLMVTTFQLEWRDAGKPGDEGDMMRWAQASSAALLPDPERGSVGRLKDPPPAVKAAIEAVERPAETDQRTTYQRLFAVKQELLDAITELNLKVGVTTEFKQPQSALRATTLVIGLIEELGDEIGRFSIRRLEANYRKEKSNSPDYVEVRLDMDFFAEEDVTASSHYSTLQRAVRDEDWCLEFPERPSKPFPEGGGLSFEGLTVHVDVSKAPDMIEATQEAG